MWDRDETLAPTCIMPSRGWLLLTTRSPPSPVPRPYTDGWMAFRELLRKLIMIKTSEFIFSCEVLLNIKDIYLTWWFAREGQIFSILAWQLRDIFLPFSIYIIWQYYLLFSFHRSDTILWVLQSLRLKQLPTIFTTFVECWCEHGYLSWIEDWSIPIVQLS